MRKLLLIVALLVPACREDAAENLPEAVAMTADTLGYYCQMNLAEHDGPKGQIHLDGLPDPIFFSQVRDTLAYLHEPERVAPVKAVYVSNMSRAESWQAPGADNWILASEAFFVVGGDAMGGMGAPELVPFEAEADARAFAEGHGGRVMRLDEVPPDAVLGAVEHDADGHAEARP